MLSEAKSGASLLMQQKNVSNQHIFEHYICYELKQRWGCNLLHGNFKPTMIQRNIIYLQRWCNMWISDMAGKKTGKEKKGPE